MDEIKETEQIVEEQQEDIVEESKEEKEEKPESKESAIKKITNTIKEFVSGGSKDEKTEGDPIPDEFTNAALSAGWDEKTIEEWAADFTNEELLEMIPSLVVEDSEESEDTSDKITKSETKKAKVEDSQEDEKITKLLKRIEALESVQEKSQKETEKQKLDNLVNRASQIFDETSKEFEIFGETEKLPKFPDGRYVANSPQMKARKEVWGIACRLYEKGMDFDEAMSVSLNAYKGKNLTKEIKRSVIKDLKKKETKLSGKRTSHESVNSIESGPEVIKAVARKHGIEIV